MLNRKFSGSLVVLALLGLILLIVAGLQWTPAAAAPSQVGVSTSGQNAFEFIGRIDQTDFNFVGHGYLTYIKDLDNAQIYTDPLNPSEDTAQFTYVANATLTSRAVLSDVFVLDSAGTITFYFNPNPPDRTFGNLNTFTTGTPIATASLRYQDILLVQSANEGLATGAGEVTQLDATVFTLGGEAYQFGAPQTIYRYSTVGNGTRTNLANPLTSFVLLAGNAVTTGQGIFLPAVNRNTP